MEYCIVNETAVQNTYNTKPLFNDSIAIVNFSAASVEEIERSNVSLRFHFSILGLVEFSEHWCTSWNCTSSYFPFHFFGRLLLPSLP